MQIAPGGVRLATRAVLLLAPASRWKQSCLLLDVIYLQARHHMVADAHNDAAGFGGTTDDAVDGPAEADRVCDAGTHAAPDGVRLATRAMLLPRLCLNGETTLFF